MKTWLAIFAFTLSLGSAWAESIEYGKDRHGSDYRIGKVSGPQQCQGMCQGDDRCEAWTWNRDNDNCYLKAPAPPAADNAKAVSGLK